MNRAGHPMKSADDPMQPRREWQRAYARLHAAQVRGDDYNTIVRLSAEVTRTQHTLTLDHVHSG